MRYLAPSFLLLLAATAPAISNGARLETRQRAQAEAGDEIIVYKAKGNESLQAIAAKWFVRPEDWRRAQALNKIKDPAKIPAGTALKLRSSWIRTSPITAELAAFRGTVLVVRGGEATPVVKGMTLAEGDIVETGLNGFATLVLPDASQVSLPSSSRIRLARLRQVPMSDSIDRRFTLEQGKSEAKVTPMTNPASRFLITTPVAVAAVRGTQFRVTYTPEDLKAVTTVTEGKVAVGRVNGFEEVLVRANYGAIATSTGVSRAFELLPAPGVDTPERLQNEKAVTFRLKPVDGADKYLVEIATDAGFVDRVGSQEITDLVAVFEGVPNGHYFVRAYAVDSLGLVGRPAQYAFERVFAGPVSEDRTDRKDDKQDIAKLGERDPADYAWFDSDTGTVNMVDAGGGGGDTGGFSGDGGDGGAGGADPVVPMEDVAMLFGDGAIGYGIGGGNAGGNSGGFFGGGNSGGNSGGFYGGGGGGGGNTGGNTGGGNTGGGNTGGGNTDGGNTDGGNTDNPGGGNTDGGNTGGGNTGGGNTGGNDTGNPGNGDTGNSNTGNGNTGNGNTGGGNVLPGGDVGNGGNSEGGNGGGNTGGDTGGNTGGDTGGVTVIPVDPSPPPPPPPGVNPPTPGNGGPGVTPGNGDNGPGNLPAIPEPATWAMLIAGFGLVGLALRRRRRLPAA